MKKILFCAAIAGALSFVWFVQQDRADWPSLAPLNAEISSGQCKAVRKQQGLTLWRCADGREALIESYMHKDKQGDWKPPAGCKPAQPVGGRYTAADAQRYRECPDGQSYWVGQ